VSFDPPTVAQAIEVIVRHRANGITQAELTEAIFGPHGHIPQQRVAQDCRWLTNIGCIRSDDGRPARYFKGRPGPSES
jgi:hypothetical protein